MDQGVDHVALVQDKGDSTGDADQHGGRRHRGEPFRERERRTRDAQAPDEPGHDPHGHERRGELIEVPSELHDPDDENGERERHRRKNRQVPAMERHRRDRLRSLLTLRDPGAGGEAHRGRDPHRNCNQEKGGAESSARTRRELCELLCD